MRARLHRLAYGLRRYHLQEAPLQRWLVLGLLAVALLAVLGVLPGCWLVVAICLILLAVLVLGTWLSARRFHVHFQPQDRPPPPPSALAPKEKYPLRATGWFEVEGKEQAFTNLEAYYATFATREHVIYAHVPRSRFLLVGQWPARDIGLWYVFFTPERLLQVRPGMLAFGAQPPRPALYISHRGDERVKELYMAFADEETRARVWADLLADHL